MLLKNTMSELAQQMDAKRGGHDESERRALAVNAKIGVVTDVYDALAYYADFVWICWTGKERRHETVRAEALQRGLISM